MALIIWSFNPNWDVTLTNNKIFIRASKIYEDHGYGHERWFEFANFLALIARSIHLSAVQRAHKIAFVLRGVEWSLLANCFCSVTLGASRIRVSLHLNFVLNSLRHTGHRKWCVFFLLSVAHFADSEIFCGAIPSEVVHGTWCLCGMRSMWLWSIPTCSLLWSALRFPLRDTASAPRFGDEESVNIELPSDDYLVRGSP